MVFSPYRLSSISFRLTQAPIMNYGLEVLDLLATLSTLEAPNLTFLGCVPLVSWSTMGTMCFATSSSMVKGGKVTNTSTLG